MNKRKGLKRLAIVLGAPWYLFWVAFGIDNFRFAAEDNAAWHAADRARDTEKFFLFMAAENTANDRVALSVMATVLGPLLLWVFYLLARWVYRGFQGDVSEPA